jgi:heat shock protein 5
MIAYRLDLNDEKAYLVYNLGQKETNLALVSIDRGVFEILATAVDEDLGEEFEDIFYQHFYAHKDLVSTDDDIKAWKRLELEAQMAGQVLQRTLSATVDFSAQHRLNPFAMIIENSDAYEASRRVHERSLELVEKLAMAGEIEGRLSTATSELSERASKLVKQLLDDAKMEEREVYAMVLTSDMTNIDDPQLHPEPYLNKKNIVSYKGVKPDQAIVYGAAMQGNVLTGESGDLGCFFFDLTQLSLGIETNKGHFTKLISRNTAIPVRKTRLFSTTRDDQENFLIRIFEGERAIARENRLVGTLELKGLPARPKGVLEIEVSFEVDPYENLKVTVSEKESGKEVEFLVEDRRYMQEEVDSIVAEAETYYEQDEMVLKENLFEIRDVVEVRGQ